MPYHRVHSPRSFAAGADLSAAQGHIVELNATGEVILAVAGQGMGILVNNPSAQGRPAMVSNGVNHEDVVAGAAIAIGDYFTSDANGRAASTVALRDAATVGRALTAAANDGEFFTAALLTP